MGFLNKVARAATSVAKEVGVRDLGKFTERALRTAATAGATVYGGPVAGALVKKIVRA